MHGIYDEVLIALHGIWQRRWLALGIGWAVALAGWLAVGLIPSRYESDARVLAQAQSLLPDKVGITPADRQQAVESMRQTLTSAVNLQKVVRETDLGKGATDDDAVAARAESLSKAIKIVAQQDNLFEISATASSPRLARQITQKLVDLFVGGNLAGSRIETTQAMKFLDQQIAQRSAQLAEAEGKRSAFQAKYMSALPGTGSIDQRLNAARAELARIDGDLAAAQSALAAVNGQMAGTPASVRSPGVMIGGSAGDGRAAAIQGQIADGQARGWTDQHPDMVALRQQLARTPSGGGSAARMSAGSSSPNPMYMSLRSMQAEKAAVAGALGARKATLQGQINAVVAAQAADPAMAAAQTEVDRNYDVLKTQYDKLLADREDVRLRGQGEAAGAGGRFSVIDPPTSPSAPASPNRPLLLTLVLLAAVGAGTGAAFALGQLRRTYPTASRLAAATGLPVIGTIGAVVSAAQNEVRRHRLRQFAGGGAALVGLYLLLLVAEFVQRSLVA